MRQMSLQLQLCVVTVSLNHLNYKKLLVILCLYEQQLSNLKKLQIVAKNTK